MTKLQDDRKKAKKERNKSIKNSLQIINALSHGVDPFSGEILPENSLNTHRDILHALHDAAELLEIENRKIKRYEENQVGPPLRAGDSWSNNEDKLLIEYFDSGKNVAELANQLQRTIGAIESRLSLHDVAWPYVHR